jgi:hypothetical protein
MLVVVREWIEKGERQKEMPTNSELSDYWLQFDTLTLENDVLYRQYFDTKGDVTNQPILIPLSMRTTLLELIHSAAGHAQMTIKNEQNVSPLRILALL